MPSLRRAEDEVRQVPRVNIVLEYFHCLAHYYIKKIIRHLRGKLVTFPLPAVYEQFE